MKINSKNTALAFGFTATSIYTICAILMFLLPKKTLVNMGNLIFHGIDFNQISRMDIPVLETIVGIISSFTLWAIVGYLYGTIYNKITKLV